MKRHTMGLQLKPLVSLLLRGRLFPMLALLHLSKPFYRLSYVASVASNGLVDMLAHGPVSVEDLSKAFCSGHSDREALEAWLQLGVKLKQLKETPQGYCLRGLSRHLAHAKNDPLKALSQEVVDIHHAMILKTPQKLRTGARWHLNELQGELIAHSSRVLEPFQQEAVERTFPVSGPVRLLEIGCGSGIYIRHAARRNPDLSAVGLEMQPEVATVARENLERWGLTERARVECDDVRTWRPDLPFDIATLHNNIYYFPVDERVALLRHVHSLLAPNGFLLLTTSCQGGTLAIEILNLWGAVMEGGGRLPGVDEMQRQLGAAGFTDVRAMRMIPWDRYYAFAAYR